MTSHLLLDIPPRREPALLPRLRARYTRDWFRFGSRVTARHRAIVFAQSVLTARHTREPPP